jgi:WD40 repeat protein
MSADQQRPPANPQPRQVRTVNPDCQMCKVRLSRCGQFLAAGGFDGKVHRWEVSDSALTALPPLLGHHGWVQALAFHADGERLFTADSWGAVRCWRHAERQPTCLRELPAAHDGWIHDLALSPDGNLLATCGMDQKVRLWSIGEGTLVRELAGHDGNVFAVAFHPDGRKLVSGDLHGNVYEWEVATGRKTRDFNARVLYTESRLQDVGGVRCLDFDLQGRTLACGGTRPVNGGNVQGTPTILLFDTATGRLQHTLSVGGSGDGFVYDLAFHPAGYVMAVASGNPGTGKFFFQRPGETNPFFLWTRMPNCHSLAFHRVSRRLIVTATNAGSNGNGRPVRNGEYRANFSPLHVWELPA